MPTTLRRRLRTRRQMTASCQRGSGTAIGIAMIFPMLMLVIVVLHSITFATRTEQSLQTAADRAAHTAALCCFRVGEALDMARESIAAYARPGPGQRLNCSNDVVGDATIIIRGVDAAEVPELDSGGVPNLVPPGGQAAVRVRCELPANRIGSFGLLGANVDRNAIGLATIDPYRHRFMPTTP